MLTLLLLMLMRGDPVFYGSDAYTVWAVDGDRLRLFGPLAGGIVVPADAVRTPDQVIADFPENPTAADYLLRGHAWRAKKEWAKARADYYHKALPMAAKDPDPEVMRPIYRSIAALYAACPDAKFRDGAKAVEWATYACATRGARNLDTLAAAYAEAGDFEKAVRCQVEAIEMGAAGNGRLKLYHARKPFRDESGTW